MTDCGPPPRFAATAWCRGKMSDKLSGVRMFSRGLVESFKQSAAFGGEAVFLQAAVGFFGDGAFDEGGCEGGIEIASFKVFASPDGQSDPANPKLHHSNFTLFNNGGDVEHGEKRV